MADRAHPAALRDYVALTKPRLSAVVLFTTAVGSWAAGASPLQRISLLALLGTTIAVAGAQTLNCYLERDLDGLMFRTRNRPLPAGRVEPRSALAFGCAVSAISIPTL